jgi:hypothetical protein
MYHVFSNQQSWYVWCSFVTRVLAPIKLIPRLRRDTITVTVSRTTECITLCLRLIRLTIWWWCPVSLQHLAGWSWYQISGNKLYQHMGTGTISESDLVYTVLGLGELEDFMEVITCIIVFVINLNVHSGTSANHPKKGKIKGQGG